MGMTKSQNPRAKQRNPTLATKSTETLLKLIIKIHQHWQSRHYRARGLVQGRDWGALSWTTPTGAANYLN